MFDETLFAPYGKFLFDPWFVQCNTVYHAFYLELSRTTDPKKRSKIPVTIGHASSSNLKDWQELSTALTPSPQGTAWDDFSLSAGSVVEKDGTYYLFYTGKNSQNSHVNIQKICLATSMDLIKWVKHPTNPIIEINPTYYDSSGLIFKGGLVGAWRDPFVFTDPRTGKYYMTISARSQALTIQYDACVALAESNDLLNWKVLPPIFSPGYYDVMDRTQVIYHNHYYYLFFTTTSKNYEPLFAKKHGTYEGLHCYYAKELTGDYKPINGTGAVFSTNQTLCDVRILPTKNNTFIGLGWEKYDRNNRFVGKLATAITLTISGDQIYVVG